MYPNPATALPLPPRPHLEQYKKQAKDLVKVCKSGDHDAIRSWAEQWIETLLNVQDPPFPSELRASIKRQVDQLETFARTT